MPRATHPMLALLTAHFRAVYNPFGGNISASDSVEGVNSVLLRRPM